MRSSHDVTRTEERQRLGFRLIIGYKFAKAALMFGVALWLTIAPGAAYRTLDFLARELAEGGAIFARAGRWIHAHLSSSLMIRGAVLAWLDSVSSALEAFLLLSGSSTSCSIVRVRLTASTAVCSRAIPTDCSAVAPPSALRASSLTRCAAGWLDLPHFPRGASR
jgi:hypothetical protein